MENHQQNNIIIASLLQNIGKFVQQANQSQYKSENINLAPLDEKKKEHVPTYTAFTYGFIDSLIEQNYFNQISDGKNDYIDPPAIRTLATTHYQPNILLSYIIAEANALSSGRAKTKQSKHKNDNQSQALQSMFDRVNLNKKNNSQKHFFPLSKLTYDSIFSQPNTKIQSGEYEKLWVEFDQDFRNLKAKQVNLYYQKLDSLLEHYLWAIPSSVVNPDISLYDHLYITAAIAAVLYQYHVKTDSLTSDAIQDRKNNKKFLFVSGDLSGIQNYIFDLNSTKNASKLLRAKSFELQALTDSVCDYILQQFNLPLFCRIINAGGKFLLLLPNIDETHSKLKEIKQKVNHFFLNKYFARLTLNISDGVAASGYDMLQKSIGRIFKEISQNVSLSKQKKMQSALIDPTCHVCNQEYDQIQKSGNICDQCKERAGTIENDGVQFCTTCQDLYQFGGELPKNKFFAWNNNQKKNSLSLFGDYYLTPLQNKNHLNNDEQIIYSINEYHSNYPMKHAPFYIPVNENQEVLTLEEIGNMSTGVKHIAMFKADLDYLGGIFTIGLKEKLSISRYASLSRMLNFFFTEFLYYFIKREYPTIYTVFSGGDDLCLIGPWDVMIQFAIEFQKQFRAFTGDNENLTISAGIALAHQKLPVKTLARMAEELLEQSKQNTKKDKNSITIFDTTVGWDELQQQITYSDRLLSYLKNGQLTKGLIYRLLIYANKAKKVRAGCLSGDNPLWKSHLKYDLARNVTNMAVKNDIIQMLDENNIDKIKIAVSNILYKLRVGD